MAVVDTRILVLCKTYPSPSGKYAETTCVAGMEESGRLIRLFPAPFRLIAKDQQFKKWQWIEAKVEKARKDHRPESFTIKVYTINGSEVLSTGRDWAERRRQISKIKLYDHFQDVETEQELGRISLAMLKPSKIIGLEIERVANPEWTEEELAKLLQEQKQNDLFDDEDKPALRTLRKLPFDFYYKYQCGEGDSAEILKHKLVDWEVGALYWNCYNSYGADWEKHFRYQLEKNIPSKDLMLLMGNQHRFQNQWLIISLIYPPHQLQPELF